jgi:hypothetical protein
MDLATKDHVVELSCKQERILLSNSHSSCPTTHVKVCLLNFLYKGHTPCCVPGVQPTPNDQLDIVEPIDSTDAAKDDPLEDQQSL